VYLTSRFYSKGITAVLYHNISKQQCFLLKLFFPFCFDWNVSSSTIISYNRQEKYLLNYNHKLIVKKLGWTLFNPSFLTLYSQLSSCWFLFFLLLFFPNTLNNNINNWHSERCLAVIYIYIFYNQQKNRIIVVGTSNIFIFFLTSFYYFYLSPNFSLTWVIILYTCR